MTIREVDYHYLRTNVARAEPRKYPSLAEALYAMTALVHLQRDRGFDTIRDSTGKHTSRHSDGRTVEFWAENERGDIVS
jgi:hypothetical protein